MSKQAPYHHGDLRNALLDAGEAELAESGVNGFSLRRVAARVGVSHAAPTHHFGDRAGLIDALAARGFAQLLAAMEARQKAAPDDPHERLVASGLGYLDFVMARPALFRLAFNTPMRPEASADLVAAASAAYRHIAQGVAAVHGVASADEPGLCNEVLRHWSQAHGFAELLLAGHVELTADTGEGQSGHEALYRNIFGPVRNA
ncbi:MAG: TetR/AcrR family transcriptional regulator [Paracoccaceae bacterium]